MLKQWVISGMIIFQCAFSSIASAGASGVPIICYHDVGGTVSNDYTITKENLKNHLAYLKANGYHPISLQQYMAFTKEGASLPDKPVMLTFDDGYISFYNDVFPLLKEYNYPAMLAIVGSWLEYSPPDVGKTVNWQQLREMDASGLVTMASHSFRSHHWTTINSQDDRGEMLSSRIYSNGHYETTEEFKLRVNDDLKQSQQEFEKELGHKVLAVVWPYGEYNLIDIEIAQSVGIESTFGLGGGINLTGNKGLVEARRGIIEGNPSTAVFASFLKNGGLDNKPMKATYLDIDAIYVPNSLRETDNNLTLAIAKFNKNGTNTVFLQTVSDQKKTGKPPEAFFHTTVIPVQADIFSHIASKLRNGGFAVYAVMPSLSSPWLDPVDQVVATEQNGKSGRVTSFSPVVQKKLIDLYTDLGSYAYADGVLFQDDLSVSGSQDMQAFTVQLMKAVHTYRPYTLFARSISPESVLGKNGNYQSYVDAYDYTIIMANSVISQQNSNVAELGNLAQTALAQSDASRKVVFMLNTFDPDKNVWISDKELRGKIDALRSKGAVNFTYYPENTLEDKVAKAAL